LREQGRHLFAREPAALNGLLLRLDRDPEIADDARYWLLDPPSGPARALAFYMPITRRLLISSGCEAADIAELTACVRDAGVAFFGVLAPTSTAQQFARLWRGEDGWRLLHRYRLYSLVPPIARRFAPGALRYARHSDEAWLERAFRAYAKEVRLVEPAWIYGRQIHSAIFEHRMLLWCAPAPVGFIEWQPGDGTGYRASSLYILPAFRRKGYGGALVSEFCARAFAGELPGVEHCERITAAANAKHEESNRIFGKVGFMETAIWESLEWRAE
jgi:GNAT superfamily N-acetyltransferase